MSTLNYGRLSSGRDIVTLTAEARVLGNIPLFAKLPPAKLKLLAFTSEAVTFIDGEELFHAGDQSNCAYVVIDGEVEVFTHTDADKASFVLGKNELIGEMGILNNAPRSATIRAKGKVRVLRLTSETLLKLLSENAEIALDVMRLLSDRLANTLHKYEESQAKLKQYEDR